MAAKNSSHPSNAFHRAFSHRELWRGTARWALVCSGLAALLLGALLVNLFLIADLLESRGRLELAGPDVTRLHQLIGRTSSDEADVPAAVSYENGGLLHAVWWSRDRFWGPALAALYRNVPALRENVPALLALLTAAFVLGLARFLALARAGTLELRAGLNVASRLRRTLHRQALRLTPGDLLETEESYARRLFTTDADRIRDGVALWVRRIGRYPLELALLALIALALHWRMAVLCLIPLGACWFLIRRQRQQAAHERQLAESRADADLRVLSESFRKTRLVRGYEMEQFEHEQFQKHLDRFGQTVTRAEQAERSSRWIGRGLALAVGTVLLFLLGNKVLQTPEDFSPAAALTLLAALALSYRPVQELWRAQSDRAAASLSADRIYRYLERIPEVGQAVGAKFLQPLSRTLQFDSVSYTLPDGRKLLDGVDLKLPAGIVSAVISLEPLEARSLAYLLPRFIEPHSGRVLFDGEDIAWATLESLRAETVFVGGADPFFTGTVLENISCGNRDYSLQDVTAAAKIAHAHNFILRLPQGYETVLGEHGEQLDPGQGFRLGLARAVLRDPALMIIEEPAAPLDEDAKSLLEDAYNRICSDRTVLFLPARLSTVRRADQVVLLHRGRVETIGRHAELVKSVPLYRHWEYVRFNEFRHLLQPVAARESP